MQKPHCSPWHSAKACWTGFIDSPVGDRASGAEQALDGGDRVVLGGDGEHQARAHRLAVDEDGAGAADAVLAADVGAGEPEVVAQEVRQQPAGRDGGRAAARR